MLQARKSVLLQDGGLLLVATTRENVSPSVVLELLQRIGGIIKVNPNWICFQDFSQPLSNMLAV